MAGRKVTSRIDAFAGLSDRDTPTSLTRIESPDLLNVDFSGRDMARRNGYTRVHTSSGMMRDSSARLDGKNDYIKIPDQTSFDFGSRGYIGIGVVLRGGDELESRAWGWGKPHVPTQLRSDAQHI